MADLNFYKKLFSKTNLYFAGSAMFLVVATVFMGIIYSNQSAENTQASLILADANGISQKLTTQSKSLDTAIKDLVRNKPANFESILVPNLKTNDLTRYFDQLESTYSKDGVFSIFNINYSPNVEQEFVTATLSMESTEENLLKFLEYTEKTGFAFQDSQYLFEVTSINFTVPLDIEETSLEEAPVNPTTEKVYNVNLQVRIYNFANQNLEITEPTKQ